MSLVLLEPENRCIMCRAEAHKLFSRKPIFDALGIQLFAVVHEHIESEVLAKTSTSIICSLNQLILI